MRKEPDRAARRSWLAAAAVWALATAAGVPASAGDDTAFTLRETFGVPHPDQIIDFDLAGPIASQSVAVVDGDGREVPSQVIDGGRKIAVRTDLPAGATRVFRIVAGKVPAQTANAVQVKKDEKAGWHEVTNGLTGVRVPLAAPPPAAPAPISAVLLRSGAWTPAGSGLVGPAAKSMAVKFIEQGPLVTIVEVSYVLNARAQDGKPVDGHYRCEVTLKAGQPSILFEEESDVGVSWALRVDALKPTQARYRGHHASSRERGYEADGQTYRPSHARPPLDAFTDLRYDQPRPYPRLAIWDPWVYDSGWYWQVYDKEAPGTADMVAVFAGRASRAQSPAQCGVHFAAQPTGILDLTTAPDGHGNLHVVLETGEGLKYVRFDPQMKAGKIEAVGAGLSRPDLFVDREGLVSILAFGAGGWVLAERPPGSPAFQAAPVAFADGKGPAWRDPYLAHAARGKARFLYGYAPPGKQGGLLFARGEGDAAFSLRGTTDAPVEDYGVGNIPSRMHPSFTARADGSLFLTFTQGHYLNTACIAPDAITFGPPQSFAVGGSGVLAFGAAVDPLAGDMAGIGERGQFWHLSGGGQAAKGPAEQPQDHHGLGPNRRSLAVSPGGEGLCHLGSNGFYLSRGGSWRRLDSANNHGLFGPRVHWMEKLGAFVVVCRAQGMLAVYSLKPGGEALADLGRFPETEGRLSQFVSACAPDPKLPQFRSSRFQWGLFVSTKGDLADPLQVQPVARQMNVHAGINLNKAHRWKLDFPDPPQGYGSPYMKEDAVKDLVGRIRSDKAAYDRFYNGEPGSRDLISFWADASGAKVREVGKGIGDSARAILDAMVNGDGIYSFQYQYWMGSLDMSRKCLWIDQVLGSDKAAPEQKAQARAAAVFFASMLFDNDFVPMDNHHGINLGTPNMPVMQMGFRNMYALLLSRHPMMKGRLEAPAENTAGILKNDIHESGAHLSCVHYIGAGMGPTLAMMQQLQRGGLRDLFRDEPRVGKFSEFYLQCATPPDVRFGGVRKNISVGDSATESSELHGELATGLAEADPPMSRRLMWMWRAQGRMHSSFFGTTLLKIDERLPDAPAGLGGANFPGYFSVLRAGFGTPQETAVWFLNGKHYWDHHHNDQGEVIAYLLGAPLSLDWGSMYCPRVDGALQHATALPEGVLGVAWNQDGTPLNAGIWSGYSGVACKQEAFQAGPEGGWARAAMQSPDGKFTWTRAVSLAQLSPGAAVLALQDAYAGDGAAAGKIFSMPLVAEGEVETPAGRQTPPRRFHGWGSDRPEKKELPSAGPAFALQRGVNRVGFTGQAWKSHPAQGIDFDVCVLADAPQKAQVGHWSHSWHPGREAQEYRDANGGRNFEESQYILRIRGEQGFRVVIVAWPKGRKPQDLAG